MARPAGIKPHRAINQAWNQPPQDQQWSQPAQGGWQNPQGGQPQQTMSAAQQWAAQQQQQQLPTLPAPVYPPGMQPAHVQAPPGLAPASAQPAWQGAATQNAPMTFQFGSSVARQQSPFGSQPQQGSAVDRQQSPFGPQPQQTAGNRPWGSSSHSIHFTEGGVFWHVRKRAFMRLLVLKQFMHEWTKTQYMKEIPWRGLGAVSVIEPELPKGCTHYIVSWIRKITRNSSESWRILMNPSMGDIRDSDSSMFSVNASIYSSNHENPLDCQSWSHRLIFLKAW